MGYTTLEMHVEDAVAVVMFNSPPVNSIGAAMIDEIDAVFSEINATPGIRAVVVGSKLEKAFIAGADIKQFIGWDQNSGFEAVKKGHAAFDKIASLPCPVICAVNGFAFGGGLELALACDIRIFDKTASVGLPETGLGILPGYGGSQRLPRLVGAGTAKLLIFTGATVNAEEAYRIGLAQQLAEPGQSVADAMKLARKIAAKAPLGIAGAKRCIDAVFSSTMAEGLGVEAKTISELFATKDKTEGATAFLEKRKPVFTGQ